MADAVKVKGIPLTLGERVYTLPPASLATLEAMAPRLDVVNQAFTGGGQISLAELGFVADFATACLRRNYPDVHRDFVAEHIGLENVVDVLQMCTDVSGLLRKQKEAEAAAPAAAPEGGTLGESAGTASPPTS